MAHQADLVVQVQEGLPPRLLVDPSSLHILLVDASSSSRQQIATLLKDCSYQVTACKTNQEAIQILKAQQGPEGTAGFDLILKEHSRAAGTNACRLLRRAQTEAVLQGIPIVVASIAEDRDVMVNCLQLGAADYMLKPLRHNDLLNLWARVYWWRRALYLQQQQPSKSVTLPSSIISQLPQGSAGSEETKCCSDDEPQVGMIGEGRPGEGSAPDGSTGNGSGANRSKSGSKERVGWSGNQPAMPGTVNSREGNGNSVTKAEQGSNQPSSDVGQAPLTSSKFANGNSGVGPIVDDALRTLPAQSSVDELLTIAPLNVSEAPIGVSAELTLLKPASSLPILPIKCAAAEAPPVPSGFRAYVATKDMARKRPAEAALKEGGHSSGSDRTASVEKTDNGKRRQVVRAINPPVSAANSSGTTKVARHSTTATSEGPSTHNAEQPYSNLSQRPVAWNNQASANGYNNVFPFGMMPTPFAIPPPQFWGQMTGSPPCPSEADVASFYSSMTQQSKGSDMQQQQQQQMAMHSQLMFQHSLLLQQFGMGGPGFNPIFRNVQQAQSHGMQAPQAGALRAGSTDGRGSAALGATSGRSKDAPSAPTPTGCVRGHSHPPSGGLTGTCTGTGTEKDNGNTLGVMGNGTGATSNSTALVGPDGCLVEPSKKERRAQALFKYKQKRKNLCFTKKIRYESRKQLAQARPRVKGQFVRVKSTDVQEVVNAITKVQKEGCSSEDAVVPQLALDKAGGNVEIAAELMEVAKKLANSSGGTQSEEEDMEDEEDEEDDIESPPLQGSLSAAVYDLGAAGKKGSGTIIAGVGTSRHSSNSGSNSPDINAATLSELVCKS